MRISQLRPPEVDRRGLRGPGEEFHLGIVLEGASCVRQIAHLHIGEHGSLQPARSAHNVAACQIRLADAAEVHRDPAARRRTLDLLLVRLEPAHAGAQPARLHLDRLPDLEGAIAECTGDDGAEAADREDAIDGQARTAPVGSRLGLREALLQREHEVAQTLAGAGRDGDDGRALQGRALQRL